MRLATTLWLNCEYFLLTGVFNEIMKMIILILLLLLLIIIIIILPYLWILQYQCFQYTYSVYFVTINAY